MEPLDIYDKIQSLVIKDAKKVTEDILQKDKYSVATTQAHTHNGIDSVQFPLANLGDAKSYMAIQTKTLSSTQVKALKDTPIILVPAPVPANLGGSGSATPKAVSIVTGITARLAYGGTAYTGANALEFRYTGAAGAKVTADISTTFLNASASAYSHVAGVVTELVPVGNAPIVVCVPTANPGAGNSPITFAVYYRVVAFNA